MNRTPRTFTFKATRIMFPDVFNGRIPFDDRKNGALVWAVTVPVEDLPPDIAECIPQQVHSAASSAYRTISLRSGRPVPVFDHTLTQTDLRAVTEFCQISNIRMDDIIRGVPAEIAAELYTRRGPHGRDADEFGLGLRAIRVDFAKVLLPTWEDFAGGN